MKSSLENNITLITEADIGSLLKNEVPYYIVSKIDDDRYAIKSLPLVMKEKRTEIDGEIAYDYSKINDYNRLLA